MEADLTNSLTRHYMKRRYSEDIATNTLASLFLSTTRPSIGMSCFSNALPFCADTIFFDTQDSFSTSKSRKCSGFSITECPFHTIFFSIPCHVPMTSKALGQ